LSSFIVHSVVKKLACRFYPIFNSCQEIMALKGRIFIACAWDRQKDAYFSSTDENEPLLCL
jgi:hypothetical protein